MNEKNEPSRKRKIIKTELMVNSKNSDSKQEDSDAIKAIFQTTLELRNFEISQLVQRNNFFMIFQGVLLAGVIQSSHGKPVVSFLVCMAGLIVSLYQIRMAAGAKYWQDYWQEALQKVEATLLRRLMSGGNRHMVFHLFHHDNSIYQEMVKRQLDDKASTFVGNLILQRYSVSQTPIYVAIGLSIIWLLLVLCTMRGYSPLGIPSFIVGF